MGRWSNRRKVSDLVGLTLASVEVAGNGEEMFFVTTDGRRFVFYHDQDCCESVEINDIVGDLSDLVGHPLLRAEERSEDATADRACYDDSGTWTFYEFATNKGSVTVRWLGISNGYYSESVDLAEEFPGSLAPETSTDPTA
jgi:hypothetical protein